MSAFLDVLAGDNFYPSGLNSTNDVLFTQSFSDIYADASLQVPWHAVLGNHGALSWASTDLLLVLLCCMRALFFEYQRICSSLVFQITVMVPCRARLAWRSQSAAIGHLSTRCGTR
jgi:hypothetical protein